MSNIRRIAGAGLALCPVAGLAFVAIAFAFAGPAQAELRWVPASGGQVPAGAVIGGSEPGRTLPVCRARYGQGGNVGVHPGKVVASNCNIGWGGREITIRSYEVLVAPPAEIRWVAASGGQVPAGAVIGGSEPGRTLPICRARYGQGGNVGVHPGKVVARNCNIGWGGREITVSSYEVMVAAVPSTQPASGANAGVPEIVKRFAPQLRFDRAAGSYGYPMSAQPFYAAMQNHKGGAFRVENKDRNTLASGTIPTYYQMATFGRQVRITYWWFYGYQHPCVGSAVGSIAGKDGSHHGDWERITVMLKEDRSDIAAITFYQHGGHYTRIAGPRDAPCTPGGTGRCGGSRGFSKAGTQPVVYVGKIAHGSYHDSNAAGPGGCGYFSDFRNPGSAADYLNTALNLIDLANPASAQREPWIADDRSKEFAWGPDGISTHPTRKAPTILVAACEGTATYNELNTNGCYKSECLSGDDQAAERCIKECEPGYTNHGLTCGKGTWPWEWKVYGRLNSGKWYGYNYPLPTSDVGLSRRRSNGAEWQYPRPPSPLAMTAAARSAPAQAVSASAAAVGGGDDDCAADWTQAVSAQAIGQRCNWLTPAVAQKLKTAEQSKYACAVARASTAEKTEIDGALTPKTRSWMARGTSNMPCNDQAKQFYDAQVGRLAK